MHLSKIIDYKRQELEHRRRRAPLKDLRLQAADAEPARDFLGALKFPPAIIAEIKKASPSAGVIRPDFDPVRIARAYEDNGAACLSVLTDEHFFQGGLEDLSRVRKEVTLPVLRKDFTLDEYHIYEARAAGADAILLIVRILSLGQLRDYAALAEELGMSALVEVHNDEEMARARQIAARLIGINNRDLDTFQVDLETGVRLSKLAPPESLLVSESGLLRRADLEKLQGSGIHAFLIGEALLRAPDPGKKLATFLSPLR